MASAGGSSWVDGERENFHRTVRALPVTHGPTELPTSPTNPQVTASLHHFAESLGSRRYVIRDLVKGAGMSMDMKDLTGFSTDEKSIDTWKGLVGLELLIDPSVKKILEFTKENLNTADSDQVLGSLRTNIPDLFEESTDISSYKLSGNWSGH